MSVFGDYARYYNLFYEDKDYAGEAAFVRALVERYRSGAKRILELGSGTGRHAALLAETGYHIHGVDRSTSMLDQARKRAQGLPADVSSRLAFTLGNIADITLAQTFDAVISLFHVFSYQTADADLAGAFRSAAQHLEPGGVLIFDCWYGPCVLSEPPAVRVRRFEDDSAIVTRISEPTLLADQNCVDVAYTVFVEDKADGRIRRLDEERHRMRYLFTPEVDAFMRSAGLVMTASGEWMTHRTPGCDTFGVYFVGTKPP